MSSCIYHISISHKEVPTDYTIYSEEEQRKNGFNSALRRRGIISQVLYMAIKLKLFQFLGGPSAKAETLSVLWMCDIIMIIQILNEIKSFSSVKT